MHEHGIEPRDFMDFVHAIDLAGFHPDAELDAAIGALPGRKVIFTNGTHDHASRILGAMKLEHHSKASMIFSMPITGQSLSPPSIMRWLNVSGSMPAQR